MKRQGVSQLNRRQFLAGCGASLLAMTSIGRSQQKGRRPNIVFIFIDDMGYADLSCFGNKDVKTANMDRLAEQGLRLTNYYVNSPICSPSRVAVTTGQYPARHRINSYLASRKRNRERNMADFLNPEVQTIAKAFKGAGYATGHFGKWHMGGGRDVQDAPKPQAYGWDESLVSFEGLGDRVLPGGGLSKQSENLGGDKIMHAPKHKITEIYVDRAVDFIRRNKDKPFYVHLWPNDVHDAHVPSAEMLDKYKAFAENPYVQKFYAVLDEMDRQIGRVIDEISKLGLDEQTLIVLTSDNGPTDWAKYYKEGYAPPGDSGPFRGRKWSLYEGGIRMPFIARWKGKVPVGRTDETSVMASIDLLPTFCSLAGIEAPEADLDGLDMSGALLGKPIKRSKAIMWEYRRSDIYLKPGKAEFVSPNLAMRRGKWKLLVNADGSGVELYDLSNDIAESRNLASTEPAIVARMSQRLLAWRKSLP